MNICIRKKAFTLAEILSVITLLGIVASIIIPATITNVQKTEFVTKAKKTYSALQNATEIWQIENNCVNNIEACIKLYNNSPSAFNDIAKNLPIVKTTSYIYRERTVSCNEGEDGCVDGKKKEKNIYGQNLVQDWLPERTTLYNGSRQTYPWQGVSSYATGTNVGGGDNNETGLYLLKDGTTISVQMPDDKKRSGFGFFDVNGKKGPNKVGVDVYPFGFGIPYNNVAQKEDNEKYYGSYARNFNPYYVEDNGWSGNGMCAVRNGSVYSSCPNNVKKNPTAYLLHTNKIPNK